MGLWKVNRITLDYNNDDYDDDDSAEHLVFSRLVRQPKPPNLRTLVLSLLFFLGLTV